MYNFQTRFLQTVTISYQLFLTIIDGKVINTIKETKSTSTFYICGAKTNDMNDLKRIQKDFKADVNTYNYGLSPLHARINFMQFLLKLAYRLDLPQFAPKDLRIPILYITTLCFLLIKSHTCMCNYYLSNSNLFC